jgi:hypothetical protein
MVAGIMFMIGIILRALNFTFFPMKALLLAGIIIACAGLAFSKLFREF